MSTSTTSTIEIRPGQPEDASTIAEFQIVMARESENLELDPAVVDRGGRAVFDDPRKGQYFIAVDGDKPVGCLHVAPEARRRGVFRSLYRHLEDMVKASDDLRGLRLYVDKRNHRDCQTYEAMGMDGEHYHLYEWLP